MRKLPKAGKKISAAINDEEETDAHDNGAIHDLEHPPRRTAHQLGQGEELQMIVAPGRDRRPDEDTIDEESGRHFLRPEQRTAATVAG